MCFMCTHLGDPLLSFRSLCTSSLRRRPLFSFFPPVEHLLNTFGSGRLTILVHITCVPSSSESYVESRVKQAPYQSSFKMPIIPWPHSSGPIHNLLVPRADWFKKVSGLDLGLKMGEVSQIEGPPFSQNPEFLYFIFSFKWSFTPTNHLSCV